jgi:chemotaxis protein CheX
MAETMTNEAMVDVMLNVAKESAREAFETMAFMPVTCLENKPAGDRFPIASVSSTVGLSGDGVCGAVSLLFSKDMAMAVFRSMMMMEDAAEVNMSEVRDAIGELGNMVAGGAKARLQDTGVDMAIGLPTVVEGENHHLSNPGDAVCRVVPMETAKGLFHMQVSVSNVRKPQGG